MKSKKNRPRTKITSETDESYLGGNDDRSEGGLGINALDRSLYTDDQSQPEMEHKQSFATSLLPDNDTSEKREDFYKTVEEASNRSDAAFSKK